MSLQWYQTLDAIPELAGLPKEEQQRIVRTCRGRVDSDHRLWIGFAASVASMAGLKLLTEAAAVGIPQSRAVYPDREIISALSTTGSLILGFVVYHQFHLAVLRPLYAKERAKFLGGDNQAAPDPS